MTSINNSQRCGFATELSGVMTGSAVTIGTLLYNPVQLIFDNQGTVDVAISVNGGTTTWKTFQGGEAMILDMRGNKGIAGNFTADVGTTFTGTGASGTFRISYTYAKTE